MPFQNQQKITILELITLKFYCIKYLSQIISNESAINKTNLIIIMLPIIVLTFREIHLERI